MKMVELFHNQLVLSVDNVLGVLKLILKLVFSARLILWWVSIVIGILI